MRPHHVADTVGGAIRGCVAAEIFADHGMPVVVIEQNERAYGKIEDGLPRWHLQQGKQQNHRFLLIGGNPVFCSNRAPSLAATRDRF